MNKSHLVTTPLVSSEVKSIDTEQKILPELIPYREVINCLYYAASESCFDLSAAINLISKF